MKLLISAICCLFLIVASACPSLAKKKPEIDADKVILVMVFDNHCESRWCPKIKALLMEVQDKYKDKIGVHGINASLKDKAKEEEKKLGVSGFVAGVVDYVPCVGVFTKKRKLVREISGLKKVEEYNKYIDKALKSG